MACSKSKPISRADVFYFAASLPRTLRKRSGPRAWRYRLPCANSSDSLQAENVVPRHFWHYVSPSTPTIYLFKLSKMGQIRHEEQINAVPIRRPSSESIEPV